MDNNTQSDFLLYKDIQNRTNGEIYIGVVGPVRTGKSTFLKQFMELFVLPNILDDNIKKRAIDELPQSAQGKTIMTTEPKFVPQDAVVIPLSDESEVKIRLIDCVGYLVKDAKGYLENDQNRMVKTPWSLEEIPFKDAADIGTNRVIKEHSTIGIVVTTDGSFGDIERENYIDAESHAIDELKRLGKPFVVVLNSNKPYAKETQLLRKNMEEMYCVSVVALNCKQMKKSDINDLLMMMLKEFPVAQINYFTPGWLDTVTPDHPMNQEVLSLAKELLLKCSTMKAVYQAIEELTFDEESCIKCIRMEQSDFSTGKLDLMVELKEKCYFEHMTQLCGCEILDEYQLVTWIKELSAKKLFLEKIEDAMKQVTQKGYGVVLPKLEEITLEEPELISHGNKYGVKLKAISPSIHLINANIETEISPIVGDKEQASDLVSYIHDGVNSKDGVWNVNIFGKTLGELMENGIKNKIELMDDACQMKLQESMQKIVNENTGGMICIII